MSYSVEWIEPIYDRTYGDVITAQGNIDLGNHRGCYNAEDLNRIENNTQYVADYMLDIRIVRVPISLAIKTNWNEYDIPTRSDMSRIINNVKLLMELSNPIINEELDTIYESTQMTYSLANAIEHNLDIMKNQPPIPIKEWLLKVNDGIIEEFGTSTAYVEEDMTVHIVGIPPEPDAQYKEFNHWSGSPEDLQYIDDVNASPAEFTMVYHDDDMYEVELTATFKTRIPRKLTLNGGIVYDDIGGSSRSFFPGDEVLILANVASDGKAFYTWEGTQEALDNLTGGTEPSTSWLIMPDTDVTLKSVYINAGKHSVSVEGSIIGMYDYGETVFIYADSPGPKYVFDFWSGSTGYLSDVTSSTFTMPDVDVSFWANWKYIPEKFQLVVNNGSGSGIYDDNGRAQIIANQVPDGYAFDEWTLDDGNGHIGDTSSASTYFYMTESNAVVTAHYAPLRTVTLVNYNNTGTSRSFNVRQGYYFTVSGTEIVGDKIIEYWINNNTGAKVYLPYFSDPMGSEDLIYTAVYRDRKTYKLTVNNGSGSGEYLERSTIAISANPAPSGKQFDYWSTSGDIWDMEYRYLTPSTVTIGHGDCTVTANYENIPTPPVYTYYTLTVNNGSGSGTYQSGRWVTCTGNQAPSGYEFSHWEENGNIISYQKSYGFSINSNRTITAHYKAIPYFTVTVIDGKLADGSTTGTFLRNSQPVIIMNPAPEGKKFLQWEVITGNADAVDKPLAETTKIRNLTQNVTVKATYYVPQPEIKYDLAITSKDGTVTTWKYSVGEQITIYADEPDEGYEFIKWTGNTQYLLDRYSSVTVVNMPSKNIELEAYYDVIGAEKKYHIHIGGGKVLINDDPEEWSNEGSFPERSTVRLKADTPDVGYKFSNWADYDSGISLSTVQDIYDDDTFITVQDFNITLSRQVLPEKEYKLTVINGERGGDYTPGLPIPIYFNMENTDDVHYEFLRWTGDTSYLKIFETGLPFDITYGGDIDHPQNIRTVDRNVTIEGLYNILYKLIVDGEIHGYYKPGDQIQLTVQEPEGKRFTYWHGDTDCLDNKYNLTVTVTMPNSIVNLKTEYHNINDNNSIGYALTSLLNNDTIDIENINIISGEIGPGFIITDSDGHIYIITQIIDNTAHIMRLTEIQGGGESGQ